MLIMPWYVLSLYPSYLGIETNVLAIDTTTAVGRYLPLAFIALLTTVLLAYTGAPLLRGAYVSVRARRPNMDLLVAVAALSAYAYSNLALATGSTHLYYDVTVTVVMVVSLGRFYEERVGSQATDLRNRHGRPRRVGDARHRLGTGDRPDRRTRSGRPSPSHARGTRADRRHRDRGPPTSTNP